MRIPAPQHGEIRFSPRWRWHPLKLGGPGPVGDGHWCPSGRSSLPGPTRSERHPLRSFAVNPAFWLDLLDATSSRYAAEMSRIPESRDCELG